MASPVVFHSDDKDLDDAALWAVIDSAAASHSSKSLKTLAFKSPIPNPKLIRNPRQHHSNSNGEVSQAPCLDGYSRPYKFARSCPEISQTSPLTVVRHVNQIQKTPVCFSSPETVRSKAYSSPNSGRLLMKEFNSVSEISPLSCMENGDKENVRHSLSGHFPSVSLFKEYQNAAMEILEKNDYTMIAGTPFIKKTGWRKISFYFNISYEIKDKTIEFDENRNVQRAEFIVRAYMQGGRFSDGWGSCERREKRFIKPNHDIPSTAETRAKNKACQDLLGIGEYRRQGAS